MTSDGWAMLITRAASLLFAALFFLWPLLAAERIGPFSFVFAAPFVLVALAPRPLGPLVGKGLMFVATLIAFYDPPSSIGFHLDRILIAANLFALGVLLAVPAISGIIARKALGERVV